MLQRCTHSLWKQKMKSNKRRVKIAPPPPHRAAPPLPLHTVKIHNVMVRSDTELQNQINPDAETKKGPELQSVVNSNKYHFHTHAKYKTEQLRLWKTAPSFPERNTSQRPQRVVVVWWRLCSEGFLFSLLSFLGLDVVRKNKQKKTPDRAKLNSD